jgi:Glycosyltransferase family 87
VPISDPSKSEDRPQHVSTSGLEGTTLAPSSTNQDEIHVPHYIVALWMAVPAFLFGLLLSGSVSAAGAIREGRVDFRQLYTAGYMVRTGHAHELYNYSSQKAFQDRVVTPALHVLPFIRPAYQSLIFVPLSFLSFRYAYAAWAAVNVILLYFSIRLLEPWLVTVRKIWKWLPFALLVGYVPIGIALMQGQDSIELLLIASGTLTLLQAGRAFPAGTLFALGLFKFQVVLPAALLFFLWKYWIFCAGFIVGGTLLAATSVYITGVAASQAYVHCLLSISSGPQSVSELILPVPIKLMPNLHGLLAGITAGLLSQPLVSMITAAASLLLTVWVWRVRSKSWTTDEQFAIVLIASSLVSYYFFLHDATILFLPLTIVLATSANGDRRNRALEFDSLACLLLFASPAWFLAWPATFYCAAISILISLFASVHIARQRDLSPRAGDAK